MRSAARALIAALAVMSPAFDAWAEDDGCQDGAPLPEAKPHRAGAAELWFIDRARPLSAHFRIALAGGLEDEPADRPGVASVSARALLGAARAAARIDARFAIEIGDRSTAIVGAAPLEEIAPVMIALLDAIRRPSFDDAAIARALAEAELAARSSDEGVVLERAVRRAAITAGTRRPRGTPSIDAAAVRGWLERSRRRIVAALIGPLEEKELDTISRALDGWPAGPKSAARSASPAARRPNVLVDRPGKGRARIALVRRIAADLSAKPEALWVLAEALSGTGGRLGRLVGPLGSAVEIKVSLGPSRYPDLMTIAFEAEADRVAQSVGEIREALAELKREPWSDTEARRAVSRASGFARLALADPTRVAAAITDARIAERPADDAEAFLARLGAVDHLALSRAAAEVLDEGAWQVVVVAEASPSLLAGLGGITNELEVWSGETLWRTPGARADR